MRKIIVFHGARGGSGQSTLIANVALGLLLSGKRVAVVDADLYTPGQHVIFNWSRKPEDKTLNSYLLGEATLREATHRLTDHIQRSLGPKPHLSGELYLLPADQTIDAVHDVWELGYDLELLYRGLTKLVEGLVLDYILVDTHPGMDPNSMLIAAGAELLYLVSSTDRQCMDSTEYLIFALRRQGETPTFMVFNKIIENSNAPEMRRNIKASLDMDTATMLPWDVDIARQLDDHPTLLRNPDGPWQRGIHMLLDHLIENSAPPAWNSDLEAGFK